jgi:hypothetical protein
MAQVVENLTNKLKALSSNLSIQEKKKKKTQKTKTKNLPALYV